jgi:hypothetical protein
MLRPDLNIELVQMSQKDFDKNTTADILVNDFFEKVMIPAFGFRLTSFDRIQKISLTEMPQESNEGQEDDALTDLGCVVCEEARIEEASPSPVSKSKTLRLAEAPYSPPGTVMLSAQKSNSALVKKLISTLNKM